MIGNRIRMDKPGPNTPVPTGTWGDVLDFNDQRGWEIRWETGATTFFPGNGDEVSAAAPEGGGRCDFCSATEPRWEHRCHDAQTLLVAFKGGDAEAFGQGSRGSWAACDVCHRLIEAGKADRLASRSARELSRAHGVPQPVMLVAIRQAHQMYWQNRVGPGFPLRPEGVPHA